MATIASVIPFPRPAAPSPGAFAIAAAIRSAGCGPEKIPCLVAGCERAGELSREIASAVAALEAPGPAS